VDPVTDAAASADSEGAGVGTGTMAAEGAAGMGGIAIEGAVAV